MIGKMYVDCTSLNLSIIMQLKIQNGPDDDDDDDRSDGNMKIFILLLIIKRASAFCEKFWLYF